MCRALLLFRLLPVMMLVGFAWDARGQSGPPTTLPSTGDSVRVFLATMQPGEESYERFGHDAIIILDQSSGDSWAYNYGVFDFECAEFHRQFYTRKDDVLDRRRSGPANA